METILYANIWSFDFIRTAIQDRTISNDIRTVLLVYLAKKCSPDRIDWSGLGLDNVTPQFLASLTTMKREARKTELTTRFCNFVNSNFKQDIHQFYLASYTNVTDDGEHTPEHEVEDQIDDILGIPDPPAVVKFPIELNLASNQIEELSIDEQDAYRQLFEHAHRLYLHDNRLKVIPTGFIAIGANLRELTLDENLFEEIDFAFLNSVPELKSLSIKNIKLPQSMVLITEELAEHDLEHLDLSGTTLDEFPVGLVMLFPQLRALHLSRCNISNIKSNLYCRLTELRNLNLEDNNISEMNCFHFAMFPVLQVLTLNGNHLKELSMSDCDFCDEPTLTQLHISNNYFDEVPKIAFQLAKLTYLGMRFCGFLVYYASENDH